MSILRSHRYPRRLLIALVACWASLVSLPLQATPEPEKPATANVPVSEATSAAREFIQHEGIGNALITLYNAQRDRFVITFEGRYHLSEQQAETFVDKFFLPTLALRDSSLIDAYVATVMKALTLEEIKELNAFYETSLGRRLASTRQAMVLDMTNTQFIWLVQTTSEAYATYIASTAPPKVKQDTPPVSDQALHPQ